MTGWRPRRSLSNRLALVFFLITLGALGAAYLYVVPSLGSRLRDEKLQMLRRAIAAHSAPLAATVGSDDPEPKVRAIVDAVSRDSSTRVTLWRVGRIGGTLQPSLVWDSARAAHGDDTAFRTTYEALARGRVVTGVEDGADGELAEAARPLFFHGRPAAVVVFSTPLADVQRIVEVVRSRLIAAGLIALVLSLALGYGVARALARRVKRLETAAEQAAAGDFSHRIPVESDDELGQLAVAFNDMQSQLAQLDEARKQFIATASHELRTPITSLGGFVELLEDEELDEETRARFVEQLREQVDRLTKLAVDLLDLSKLEAGSLELRPEPVDLGELARSVASEFEPALDRHDSHLEIRLAVTPIEMLCDPVRVAQIMRILLDNALTHTPPGTEIGLTAVRDNGRARLSVRDSGPVGIRRQELGRIFEPFHTGGTAPGSGLGLAIASELAERMAGRLQVESRPGDTVFTLELPA